MLVGRGGVEPPTFHFSGGRSYQLSYLTERATRYMSKGCCRESVAVSLTRVKRAPHENVATVLVHPVVLRELELDLMSRDLWVWPIATAAVYPDGRRAAFQIRRRMIEARHGAWGDAEDWVPVWIAFGATWHHGDEPLPWAAHAAVWDTLARFSSHVHYRKWLGGIPKLPIAPEPASAF